MLCASVDNTIACQLIHLDISAIVIKQNVTVKLNFFYDTYLS